VRLKRSKGGDINSISWETIPYIYNANTGVGSSYAYVVCTICMGGLNDLSRTDVESKWNRSCNHRITPVPGHVAVGPCCRIIRFGHLSSEQAIKRAMHSAPRHDDAYIQLIISLCDVTYWRSSYGPTPSCGRL